MLSDLLTGTDLGFDQRRFLQQVAANADSWLVKILKPSDCCTFNLEWGTHVTLPHTGDQGTLKKTNQDCKSQMMEISATTRCLSDMTCLWHARTLKSCLHRACTIGPKHSILEGERLMGSQPGDIMVITDCLGRGIHYLKWCSHWWVIHVLTPMPIQLTLVRSMGHKAKAKRVERGLETGNAAKRRIAEKRKECAWIVVYSCTKISQTRFISDICH